MKLKNKQTGEIKEVIVGGYPVSGKTKMWECSEMDANEETGYKSLGTYTSLAELNKEWEDMPEEPKEYWYIDPMVCGVYYTKIKKDEDLYNFNKQIGNYFETKEEAEKVVEKLKAFERLKAKGFRFEGWEDLQAEMGIDDLMLFNRDVISTDNVIGFRMDDYHNCIKDLNTCFGGEG